MNVIDIVPVRGDCGTNANKTAESLTKLDEEIYRQIAAFAEKSWSEVSVSQSLYDEYIRLFGETQVGLDFGCAIKWI